MKHIYLDYENVRGFNTLQVDIFKHKDVSLTYGDDNAMRELMAEAFDIDKYDALIDAIFDYLFKELRILVANNKDIEEYEVTMKDVVFHFTIL